jgi:arabinan endo-1,5-alpha-L-arabinosidase
VLGTAPGELQKLEVQASTNDLLLGGMLNVAVLATYQNVANVNVSAQPETVYQTTDPQVITVDKTGRIQAMGLGTASIIATWQNLKATNTFTVTAVPGVPAKPTLVHRYNFSDATGSTTVKDLVGSADGVIVGGTPQFTADGRLNLNGAYVQLPAGIIGSLTNITVETWVTWNGGADWQRVFDFGSTSGTPGAPGAGITWFGIAPRRGDSQCMGFAVITPGQAETIMNAPAALPIGQETHLVLSYNYLAGVVRLYQNGQLLALLNVSHPLSNLQDTFNVIGFSEWTWDPTFNGQFNEFRLYSGAFLDTDVNASLAAGPDALPGIEVKVQLKIERAGTNVILSWPTSAVGFALESTASLNSPINWSPVNDTPVQEGDMYKVTLSVSPTMQFFRLKK